MVFFLVRYQERIPGGLAKGKSPQDFDSRSLDKGIEVELEHTPDRDVAREISMDHLTEDSKYYEKLEKVEKKGLSQPLSLRAFRVAQLYMMGKMK